MEVTIRHRGRNDEITFPLLEESGQPLFSVDYGKPNMEVYEEGGEIQPRFIDESSSLEQAVRFNRDSLTRAVHLSSIVS